MAHDFRPPHKWDREAEIIDEENETDNHADLREPERREKPRMDFENWMADLQRIHDDVGKKRYLLHLVKEMATPKTTKDTENLAEIKLTLASLTFKGKSNFSQARNYVYDSLSWYAILGNRRLVDLLGIILVECCRFRYDTQKILRLASSMSPAALKKKLDTDACVDFMDRMYERFSYSSSKTEVKSKLDILLKNARHAREAAAKKKKGTKKVSTTDVGDALEELASYLFGEVLGFKIEKEREVHGVDRIVEIENGYTVVHHEYYPAIVVSCKNEEGKVGLDAITNLAYRMTLVERRKGWKGIVGIILSDQEPTGMWSVANATKSDAREMIIVNSLENDRHILTIDQRHLNRIISCQDDLLSLLGRQIQFRRLLYGKCSRIVHDRKKVEECIKKIEIELGYDMDGFPF